jgi:hypothetical protein
VDSVDAENIELAKNLEIHGIVPLMVSNLGLDDPYDINRDENFIPPSSIDQNPFDDL